MRRAPRSATIAGELGGKLSSSEEYLRVKLRYRSALSHLYAALPFDFWLGVTCCPRSDYIRVSAVEWLNGAQVDDEGRLILTRDYIVRCLVGSPPPPRGAP